MEVQNIFGKNAPFVQKNPQSQFYQSQNKPQFNVPKRNQPFSQAKYPPQQKQSGFNPFSQNKPPQKQTGFYGQNNQNPQNFQSNLQKPKSAWNQGNNQGQFIQQTKKKIVDKMQQEIQSQGIRLEKDLNKILGQTRSLMQQRTDVTNAMAKMKKYEDDMKESQVHVQQELKQLEVFVRENENVYMNSDSINNVVKGQDVSSLQIVELTSDIQAIKDVFYYAKKSMKNGQIDYETFKNVITKYSNELFDKMCLLNKILRLQMSGGQ